ncbi:carboxypeptidase regulatory-like domain-containing protein [Novipirellula artificiosorum]|uniref:Cna protein B-type domain protein n=1 Tax=Novipirellula artificiosorum TaxID=2528016 RepID=A0A5C6DXS2_9BACT|nr:carboxypeptidase regulatory-like domain-containing protein [Novipirellula artificiosorum]TWU39629.1 Cna protein B-type domain protein [Novipirellula artificiosorum]
MKRQLLGGQPFSRKPWSRAGHARRRRPESRRLLMEQLEDRRVLAVVWATDIEVDTTWTNDEVQHVTADIAVKEGVTLTIEPGTMVQFAGLGLSVKGTMIAVGTEAEPILFTSDRDDMGFDGVLGTADDVNTTGNAAEGAWQGAWRNIAFASTSTGSKMDHVEVRGGGSDFVGQIVVNGGELSLTNSRVRIGNVGMRIDDADSTVANTSFENHRFAAMSMDLDSQPDISNITFTDNALNGVQVDAGELSADRVWDNSDVVYRLAGRVTVPQDMTLTLAAGQIIKMGGHDSNLIINGRLLADGTSSAPVIVTSTRDDSAGGDTDNNGPSGGSTPDWGYIEFTSTSTGNVLDHFESRYGGGGEEDAYQLFVNGGELTLSNSVVRHGTRGMRIVNSDPVITNTAFLNNAYLAASMDLTSNPTFQGITTTGNRWNALLIDGGVISGDRTWDDPDMVYMPMGAITISEGSTLTLGAGQIVKPFGLNTVITVAGRLLASGTENAPVIVTSYRDDSAGGDTDNSGPSGGSNPDWSYIEFTNTSTGSVLDHFESRYGGDGEGKYQLFVNGGELTLTNSVLRHGTRGIRIVESDPVITNTAFLNNAFLAASMDLASNPMFQGITTAGNQWNSVLVDGGTLPGDTVWDDPDIVYTPTGEITVPVGTTLTLAAGQVVKMGFAGSRIGVDGTLLANGTEDAPVIFTSLTDDSAGGDTNDNGPSGGWSRSWQQIEFTDTSTGSELNHIELRYGGAADAGRTQYQLYVNGGELTLNDAVIRGGMHGMRIVESDPVINNITFLNNEFHAASMDLKSNPTIRGDIRVDGNRLNGLLVDAGTIDSDATWDDPGIAYVPTGRITVAEDVTLTIAPGQVIKFLAGEPIEVGGRMLAQGTSDEHIVFTSVVDDSVLGDTNDNGPSGGWAGVCAGLSFLATNTESHLDYAEIRFGGSGDLRANVAVGGGQLLFTNSVTRHSAEHGLLTHNTGHLKINNSISRDNLFGVFAIGDSTVVATNNNFDANRFGVYANAATVDLTNNLITNNTNHGIFLAENATINAAFNNVFNPGAVNYGGLEDRTGTDGNLSADPRYFSHPNRQYQLRGGSPVIDSGTSDDAPMVDAVGNPRFDDPNMINRGAGAKPYVDLGALERQETSTSDVDLMVVSVAGPASGLQDEVVTVSWTGRNHGIAPAIGPWRDAVYLSADPVWTPDDLLLGEASYAGTLDAGVEYSLSKAVTLPGVVPGDYYFLVRANWQHEVFEATALLNNTGASTDTVQMDVPELTLGIAKTGTLAGTGDAKLFKVNLTSGESLSVNLDGDENAVNELYLKYGDAPTPQVFDARGVRVDSADQVVAINNTNSGMYYVSVIGTDVSSPQTFTVTADLASLGISTISPQRGSNTGQTTIVVSGSQFASDASVRLIDSQGTQIEAFDNFFSDSGLISGTFDLAGATLGPADVQVVQPDGTTTVLEDAFEVIAGVPGQLEVSLVAPQRMRLGRGFEILIDYENRGDTDLIAPILTLTSTGIDELLISPDSEGSTRLDLIATNDEGPAGILPPGAKSQITVYGLSTDAGTETFELSQQLTSDWTIPWDTLKPTLKPEKMADAEFELFFNQLRAQIGETGEGYAERLAHHTTLLPQKMGDNFVLADVFGLESLQARAELTTSVHGRLLFQESGLPAGDVALTLFDQINLVGHGAVSLTDGTFIFPDVHSGSYSLVADGVNLSTPVNVDVDGVDILIGDVTVSTGSSVTGTLFESDGSPARNVLVSAYSETAGFYGTETDSNGVYQLVGLPNSEYEITAGGDNFSRVRREDIVVSENQQLRNVNLIVESAASISGVVKTATGQPVEDAIVVAMSSQREGNSTRTTSDGSYQISGLAAETYTISVSASGFVPSQVDGLDVDSGQTLTNIAVSLNPESVVSGVITDADTGNPIRFAGIVLLDGDDVITAAQANSDGQYEMAKVPAGSFRLLFTANGYLDRTVNIVVGEEESLTHSQSLLKAGTVAGSVKDSSGQPIPGVLLLASREGEADAFVTTNAVGQYEFRDMLHGTYRVHVQSAGVHSIESRELTLTEASPTATQDFTFTTAGMVSGTVLQADGVMPIEGAYVKLFRDNREIDSVLADENGQYSFVLLDAATYTIAATTPDLTFSSMNNVDISGGSHHEHIDFVPGTQTLQGVLRDATTGDPLANASVLVNDELLGIAGMLPVVSTNAAGEFRIEGLAAGRYEITAYSDQHATLQQTIDVSPDVTAPLDLPMGPGHSISGTIVDLQFGRPIADASVSIYRKTDGKRIALVATDECGNYNAANLEPGDYDIATHADSRQLDLDSVSLSGPNTRHHVALDTASTSLRVNLQFGGASVKSGKVVVRDDVGRIFNITPASGEPFVVIQGLPPGDDYEVEVITPGGFAPPTNAESSPQGGTVDINITPTSVGGSKTNVSTPPPTSPDGEGYLTRLTTPDDLRKQLLDSEIPSAHPKCRQQLIEAVRAFDHARNSDSAVETAMEGKNPTWAGINADSGVYWATRAVVAGKVASLVFNTATTLKSLATLDLNKVASSQEKIEAIKLLVRQAIDVGGDLYSSLQNTGEQSRAGQPDTSGARAIGIAARVNAWLTLIGQVAEQFDKLSRVAKQAGIPTGIFGPAIQLFEIRQAVIDAIDEPKKADEAREHRTQSIDRSLGQRSFTLMRYWIALQRLEDCNKMHQNEPGTLIAPSSVLVRVNTQNQRDYDPNDKIGRSGFGAAGFMQPRLLNYEILFENDPDSGATLSAETVVITDSIDENLDLSRFEFTSFGFRNFEFDVPAGLSHYETTIDLRPDGIDLLVPVELDLDLDTRTMTASFASLDPLTGLVPDDIDAGFLPVNDKTLHNGEGFLRYRVQPKNQLPSGTEIRNQASIVFGVNDPILTPETVHTIDRGAPASSVSALDEVVRTAEFTVSWSGEDDENGSGIGDYNLYVSQDQGPFTMLLANTEATSYQFTGEPGSRYAFASVAMDNVGHVESKSLVAEAATEVALNSWVNHRNIYDVDNNGKVTAFDALLVINELTDRIVHDPHTKLLMLRQPEGYQDRYLDVEEDWMLTALDALRVINQLSNLAVPVGPSNVGGEAFLIPIDAPIPFLKAEPEADPRLHEVAWIAMEPKPTSTLSTEWVSDGFATSRLDLPDSTVSVRDSEPSPASELDSSIELLATDVANQWVRRAVSR